MNTLKSSKEFSEEMSTRKSLSGRIKRIKNFSISTIKKVNNRLKSARNYINQRPILKKVLIVCGTTSFLIIITVFINPAAARAVEPVIKKGKLNAKQRAARARGKIAKQGGIKTLKNGNQIINPDKMPGFVDSVYSTKKLQIRRNELWAAAAVGSILSPFANALALTAVAGGTLYLGYETYKYFIKTKF